MSDPWQILRDAGLPMSRGHSGGARDVATIGFAVREAIAGDSGGREAEALAAFILAWHSHWPSSFASTLGDRELDWAERHAIDRGRFLKLRRIAIANLAQVL